MRFLNDKTNSFLFKNVKVFLIIITMFFCEISIGSEPKIIKVYDRESVGIKLLEIDNNIKHLNMITAANRSLLQLIHSQCIDGHELESLNKAIEESSYIILQDLPVMMGSIEEIMRLFQLVREEMSH